LKKVFYQLSTDDTHPLKEERGERKKGKGEEGNTGFRRLTPASVFPPFLKKKKGGGKKRGGGGRKRKEGNRHGEPYPRFSTFLK